MSAPQFPIESSTNGTRMTKSEREELATVVRLRAKVARSNIDARKAELLADFEAQLAERYRHDDERWAAAGKAADEEIQKLNERIREVFDAAGVAEQYRPAAYLSWRNRGENADPARRAELRRSAVTRLDALARAAKTAIDAEEARLRGDLALRALDSEEAQRWIAALPTVEALMPSLDIALLEASVSSTGGRS